MLITYRLAEISGYDARILVNVAGGVIILPFFLFSAPGGQLSDKKVLAGCVAHSAELEHFVIHLHK